ncbi:GYF domain-containing protein [Haloferula sargassicola]|uniref:GYF domain-containing protein n=1 Tax=Haloferula sargassicola TaxID=490096 RepID=A0ABP9ULP6_9BACT
MSQWYYSHDGQQKGPVPVSELSRLASAGDFDPETDLVWREGMPDWQPAVTVDDLPFGKPADPVPVETVEASAPGPSPYQSPVEAPAPTPAPASTAPVPVATAGLAIASLVCGVIGFFTCFLWCLAIPAAVAAIITGHMAVSKIKAEPERLKGKGLATAGLVSGYLGLLLAVLYGIAMFWLVTRSPEQIENMDWIPEQYRESISHQIEMQREMQEKIEQEQNRSTEP